MKKYMSIENIKLKDIKLSATATRKSNIGAFDIGDNLIIQEKIDGSCASFQYLGNGNFISCSRRKVLDSKNTLDGFYNYCEKLAKFLLNIELKRNEVLKNSGLDIGFDYNQFIIYGEWTGRRNKIVYDSNPLNKWFVFDIFDTKFNRLLNFHTVQMICEELSLDCVHLIAEIYDFRTWDTILPFANINYSYYGKMQEGIIVKNQTKIENDYDGNYPIYLKIVNKDFREVKKEPSPEKLAKDKLIMKANKELINIVTNNRIDKCLRKLQEDKIIPKEITDKDLQIVFKNLPKMVIEDIIKEEKELYNMYNEVANKVITKIVVTYIKSKL